VDDACFLLSVGNGEMLLNGEHHPYPHR